MKIRTQIFIGFLSVLIMFSIVTVVNINLSDRINLDVKWLSKREDIMKNSALMQKAVVDMETGLRGYLLSDNDEFMEPYYEAEIDYKKLRDKQVLLLSDLPEKIKELNLIHEKLDNWITKFAKPLLNAKKLSIVSPQNKKQYEDLLFRTAKKGVGKDITDEIRYQFDIFDADLERKKAEKTRELMLASETADNITLSLNLSAVIVAFITALLIARLIGKRINDMVKLSETISSGNFNVKIKSGRRDELNRLGLSMTSMAETLNENFHNIARVNKELYLSKIEVEKNAKSKEQFFANMSHEIRTPLNAIIGFSEQLGKTNLSEVQKKYLNAVQTSGNNLIELINDILDISKLNAGKIILEKVPFILSRQIASIMELFSIVAKEKGINLKSDIDNPSGDFLIGDPTRLSQILINLVGNAVKFTQKGEVTLRVKSYIDEADSVWLDFSVSDTGIGIPEEELSGIFDSFSQGCVDTTRKFGGTGLGLTIVKNLLELHGSIINVKSKPGKGSVFSFRMKFRKTQEFDNLQIEDTTEELRPGLIGIKVLLVEDNYFNQMLVESIIENWKWKVEIAGSGNEALELLVKNEYDFVFLDIRLPDMSGYDIIKFIRNKLSGKKASVPVIAMTAHSLDSEGEKCFRLGMNGFITKPFNETVLYKKVTSILKYGRTEEDFNDMPEIIIQEEVDENVNPADLAYIKRITGNDKVYIIRMIDDFILQAKTEVNKMKSYCENHEWDKLKGVVHSMKTSYMMMGINEAASLLNNIENYSYTENTAHKASEMVNSLELITVKATKFLNDEKINLKSNENSHENN
ncbi:MAG: ATP-binding protein [Bacteroidota bacterium]